MEKAEGAEIYLNCRVFDSGRQICAKIGKGKGGGWEVVEVVGRTELSEVIDACLVCLPGRRGYPKGLEFGEDRRGHGVCLQR